ncbi:hypothetical protein QR680_008134 [Steinernema hermaphroditum]|uniref:Serine/threonine-protein phosphatase n=1 Tax=Steinernema hermaphroditum TaxID=289476 RepID=A0AA39IHV3_9BILA|nr:hypothetical protein QR680_008134 [Steinernema hermaphroditum]
MRTDEDVMSVLGHLISLSNREPDMVADWVKESNFPSILASHTLRDDAPAENIFRALVSLYVLGYGQKKRKADAAEAVSILHSFDTLMPELLKRMEVILKGNLTQLPITQIIQFIAILKRLNVTLDANFTTLLVKAIEANIGSLSTPADVITVLRNVNLDKGILMEQVLAKASELVPVMSTGELASIIKFLSDNGRRSMTLLPPLANALAKSFDPLTVNQILTVSYAAANLNFRDAALMRRLSEEIQMSVSSFTSWRDMMDLMGSLNRLGIGDIPMWKCMVHWMKRNIENAPPKSLSLCLTYCGMANVSSKELRQIGDRVAARLAPTANESPIHWMNAVYAMTLLQSLRPKIAEQMLRKEFVDEIMNIKDIGKGSQLLYKLKIAQINASTKYDIRGYAGAMLNKEDIVGEDVKVEEVSRVKQSKRGNNEFNNMLLFLASQNHLSKPMLTDDCILVDAFAEMNGDGRFVSVKDWNKWMREKHVRKGNRRLAFIYVAYNHTLRDTARGREDKLRPTGDIAMDIRHLKAQGFTPSPFVTDRKRSFDDEPSTMSVLSTKTSFTPKTDGLVAMAKRHTELMVLADRMIYRIRRWQHLDGFTEQQIISVKEMMRPQPALIEVSAPLVIFGDVHGQLDDLLRFISIVGAPPDTKLLFLGDYVDRCKQSLEVVMLLFCYKIRYPNMIDLLRGNHECAKMNRYYGFYEELRRKRSSYMWKKFQECFNELPLCALVGDRMLCMHGGISPHIRSWDNLKNLPKPRTAKDCDHGIPLDLMWSDPTNDACCKWQYNKVRNASWMFGDETIKDFCKKLELDLIVRAHEVVPEGHQFFANQRLVTVFSAPFYCGIEKNRASVMKVSKKLEVSFVSLQPLFNTSMLTMAQKKELAEQAMAKSPNPVPHPPKSDLLKGLLTVTVPDVPKEPSSVISTSDSSGMYTSTTTSGSTSVKAAAVSGIAPKSEAAKSSSTALATTSAVSSSTVPSTGSARTENDSKSKSSCSVVTV